MGAGHDHGHSHGAGALRAGIAGAGAAPPERASRVVDDPAGGRGAPWEAVRDQGAGRARVCGQHHGVGPNALVTDRDRGRGVAQFDPIHP